MRMLVLFDLPTETKSAKRDSARFRKALLRDGFIMMQESVYIRSCSGRDALNKHRRRIMSYLPQKGKVFLLTLTDQQFDSIEALLGVLPEETHGYTELLVI